MENAQDHSSLQPDESMSTGKDFSVFCYLYLLIHIAHWPILGYYIQMS